MHIKKSDGQQKSFDEVYKEKIFFRVGIDNTGNFPIKKNIFLTKNTILLLQIIKEEKQTIF